MSDRAHAVTVDVAKPAEYASALEWLALGRSADERQSFVSAALVELRNFPAALRGLFVARREERIIGATWTPLLPGRCATVWPPAIDRAEDEAVADALSAAAIEFLSREGVCVAQSLLEKDTGATFERLTRAGFERMADLLYLVSHRGHFPKIEPSTELEYLAVRGPDDENRLARVLAETYVETRDCPTLNGVREIDDVLDGYRGVGVFDPARWLLVRNASDDVGCLLLSDHPENDQWELVYMGLVPEVRGRGLGIEIVRMAQWLAGRAGRERLVLAVDDANEPAKRIYAAAGFVAWDRRTAMIRIIDSA